MASSRIKINSKQSIDIDTNVYWLMIYKEQFGHDITPDLLPALASIMDILIGMANGSDEVDIENIKKYVRNIDPETVENALIQLSGMEMVTMINIVWALAKNANEDIPPVKDWVKSLDTFPIDVIAPEVFKAILKSSISSKNLNRLKSLTVKDETKSV